MKKLRKFNGRGHGNYKGMTIYVPAFSIKQASELVNQACYGNDRPKMIDVGEINHYHNHDLWGDEMEGIEPTEPCVYVSKLQESGNTEKVI